MEQVTLRAIPPVYPPEIAAQREEALRLLGELDALMIRQLEPGRTRFAEARARYDADPERYEDAYREAYDRMRAEERDWLRERERHISNLSVFEMFAQPRFTIEPISA